MPVCPPEPLIINQRLSQSNLWHQPHSDSFPHYSFLFGQSLALSCKNQLNSRMPFTENIFSAHNLCVFSCGVIELPVMVSLRPL